MKLWVSLYGMIWLVLVQIWLGFTPIAPPVPLYLHLILGFIVLVVAYVNYTALRESNVLGRIKRTARATFALTILMAILGAAIYSQVGSAWTIVGSITIESGLRFLHFVNAMAILSQVSATAVVYDVWEEKEFLISTRSGEIPRPPGQPSSEVGRVA